MRYEILWRSDFYGYNQGNNSTGLFFDDTTGGIYVPSLGAIAGFNQICVNDLGDISMIGTELYIHKNNKDENIRYDKIKRIEKEGEWEAPTDTRKGEYEITKDGLSVIINDRNGKHLLFCLCDYINENNRLIIDNHSTMDFLLYNNIKQYTNPVSITVKLPVDLRVAATLCDIKRNINIKEILIEQGIEKRRMNSDCIQCLESLMKDDIKVVIKIGNSDKNRKIIEKQ